MDNSIEKRFLSAKEVKEYLNLSEVSARKFCDAIGATRHLEGVNRILFDKIVIDAYFSAQTQPNKEGEGA